LRVNPAGSGGVAEIAVRRDRRRLAGDLHELFGRAPLAVAHLIEPEVLRVLQPGDVRLDMKRQRAVARPEAVLNPPRVPGRRLDKAVPARHVQHADTGPLDIWHEEAIGTVEQLEVFSIAVAGKP